MSSRKSDGKVVAPEPPTRVSQRAYHHGDLRAALLEAAEAELREHGPVGFSLRATARRAQVSHAAPAHHFSNAESLLSALADVGFDRMARRIADDLVTAGTNPVDRLAAAGRAYVGFARDNAHLFRLMFEGRRTAQDTCSATDVTASQRAFGQMRDCVAAVQGPHVTEAQSAAGILTAWGVVHGIAHLAIEGSAGFLGPLSNAVDAAIAGVAHALAPLDGAQIRVE